MPNELKSHMVEDVINQPLLMSPNGGSHLLHLLGLMSAPPETAETESPESQASFVLGSAGRDDRYRPYVIENGVARIQVRGTLMHKQYSWGASTRYQQIIQHLELATEDDEASATLLDFHTPGGAVYGCFDTAERISELAKEKPIIALCNDQATSAGMALASACTRRLVTQTGDMGSVGVLRIHMSVEKAMERWGEQATLIFAGAHKVDGNPYQNLPDAVYSRFLQETQELRNDFANLVARGTGQSMEHVLGTEAAIYRGQKAIEIGFADEMVNGHKAIEAVTNYLAQQSRSTVRLTMSKQESQAAASEAELNNTTQSTESTEVPEESEAEASQAQSQTEASGDQAEAGNPDPVAAERDRVLAIVGAGSEFGCADLAAKLVKQGTSAEDAREIIELAGSAGGADVSRTDTEALDRVMGSVSQPNVSADSGAESEGNPLLMAYSKATGEKF